jgi:hypothetical protein
LADDAPDAMGVVKLSHGVAVGDVDAIYLPNHHIFYGERVGDATDSLPKWKSFPEGNLEGFHLHVAY